LCDIMPCSSSVERSLFDSSVLLINPVCPCAILQLEAAIASKKVLGLITHMCATVDMGMMSLKEEQAPSSWPVLVDALQRLLTHMQNGQQVRMNKAWAVLTFHFEIS
jgi:hypothetical protein